MCAQWHVQRSSTAGVPRDDGCIKGVVSEWDTHPTPWQCGWALARCPRPPTWTGMPLWGRGMSRHQALPNTTPYTLSAASHLACRAWHEQQEGGRGGPGPHAPWHLVGKKRVGCVARQTFLGPLKTQDSRFLGRRGSGDWIILGARGGGCDTPTSLQLSRTGGMAGPSCMHPWVLWLFWMEPRYS